MANSKGNVPSKKITNNRNHQSKITRRPESLLHEPSSRLPLSAGPRGVKAGALS